MNNFIFLGAPGAGKGSLAVKVAEEYKIPHISTGDIFRANIKAQTPLGVKVKAIIDSGSLVSDDLTFELVKDRLAQDDCKNGFILDGFPRSLEQAEILDQILGEIDANEDVNLKVIYFDIPMDNLVERIVNRRSCPACGAIFNIKTMTLKNDGKCDNCDTELVQRADDNEETAKARCNTYFEQTAPLTELYEKRGNLVKINAAGTIDEVFESLKAAIK